ncbi:MAG: EAL domain-containing protein [Pseudomonadota bacterium]|nr:EAL domain-containing protein [Pseudomonadota bacterium]
MDKLKYGNDVENADEQEFEQLYKTCYGLSCKFLRLPQAVAAILFKPKARVLNSKPFGALYLRSSARNIYGNDSDAEAPEWTQINDVNIIHESSNLSKVSQSLLQQHPELLNRCEKLLTEDVELKVSILGCHTVDVLWPDINQVMLKAPIQQITFFPFNTDSGIAYLAILHVAPLLHVFQQSIKLVIQTANAFKAIKQKRRPQSLKAQSVQNLPEIKGLDAYLQPLLGGSFSPVVVVSDRNEIAFVNGAFCHLLQLENMADILGVDISRYVFLNFNGKNQSTSQRVNGCTVLGQALVLKINMQQFVFNDHQYRILYLQDKTKSIWHSGQKKIYQHQLSSIFDLALVGIFEVNTRDECVFSNAYLDKLLGKSIVGKSSYSWLSVFSPDDQQEIQSRLAVELQYTGIYTKYCQVTTHSKENLWIRFHACRNQAPHGGFVGTITDETAQRVQEIRLRELAELDQLTGLVNRHVMYSRLKSAIEYTERYGPFVVMCLDLDGFKNINDSLGHDIGDALLVEVSQRLKQSTRKVDVIVRMGGDEFVVLLANGIHETAASRVAHDIIAAIRKPFYIESRTLYVTVSIGIVICDRSDMTPSTLLKQGDIALYQAKAAGRNNFQFFTPELDQAAKQKLDVITQLHEALSKKQFSVEYQPQINIETGETFGFEALLRWSLNNEVIAPSEFIGLLEDTGLIHDVSTWMLEVCFADFAQWRRYGWVKGDEKLCVNISSSQLLLKGFVDRLEETCHQYNLAPSDIILELNETSFMDRVIKGESVVQEIKARGFVLAIDDFGTGYSSISALIHLSVDYLKIDTSLLRDIFSDQEDRAIVDSILAIGKRLGIPIIAVGVDDQSKIEYLREHGCTICQGFVFSKPLNALQLEHFFAA